MGGKTKFRINADITTSFPTTQVYLNKYLTKLPIYRQGSLPLTAGVEIGLAHGFFLPGPFVKLGPLRNDAGGSVLAGSIAAAAIIIILSVCLTIYGIASYSRPRPYSSLVLPAKSATEPSTLFSSRGWDSFSSGWLLGGFSGVLYFYLLSSIMTGL